MSEVKWIKIAIGMPDDEKIKLIDALENRDVVHYVLLRLLIQAGKTNEKGRIFLSETIPYTNEMLAVIFNRPLEAIKASLKILAELKIIEIDKDNFIRIINWEKYQNIEGMERIREQSRKRAKDFRDKNKAKSALNSDKTNIGSLCIENNKPDSHDKEGGSYDEKEKEDFKNTDDKEILNALNNNAIVTQQREKENEKEIKNEIVLDGHTESNAADEILEYIKKVSGKAVKIKLSAIEAAVSTHGADYVKLAVNKAVKVNKIRMNYINGILKNWQAEGYPELGSVYENYYKVRGRKLSFINFEPRKYDYDALEKSLLGWDEE